MDLSSLRIKIGSNAVRVEEKVHKIDIYSGPTVFFFFFVLLCKIE